MIAHVLAGRAKGLVRDLLPPTWTAFIIGWLAPKCQRGRGVYIGPGVQMVGAALIKIGDHTAISEGTWLNVNTREPGEIGIEIGANCFIGRRNFFSSGGPILIGDYCLTTIDCKFICSSHIISDPLLPIMTTGTTSDQAIRVGVNCFIGAGAMILGNIQIGHGCVIGAGAQLMRSVPPFSVCIGNPARIVKRFSFVSSSWIEASDVSDESELQYPSEERYLEMLKESSPRLSMPLVAASSHFGNL